MDRRVTSCRAFFAVSVLGCVLSAHSWSAAAAAAEGTAPSECAGSSKQCRYPGSLKNQEGGGEEPARTMLIRAVTYNVRRFKAVGTGDSTVKVSKP